MKLKLGEQISGNWILGAGGRYIRAFCGAAYRFPVTVYDRQSSARGCIQHSLREDLPQLYDKSLLVPKIFPRKYVAMNTTNQNPQLPFLTGALLPHIPVPTFVSIFCSFWNSGL